MESRVLVARSTDGGVTWSDPAPLQVSAVGDFSDPESFPRYPQLGTDGRGLDRGLGLRGRPRGHHRHRFRHPVRPLHRRRPTWSDPAPLGTDAATDLYGDFAPRLATDRLGTWVAIWQAAGGPAGQDNDLFFARSTDDGATWSAPAPMFTTLAPDGAFLFLFPALTTDGLGTWVAVWNTDDDGGGTLAATPISWSPARPTPGRPGAPLPRSTPTPPPIPRRTSSPT